MSESRQKLIKDLLSQLNNDDWLIRYNAAKILGKIDAEEAINDILEKLKRENNRDVRRSIVNALDEINMDITIPELIQTMKSDSSMLVRYTAARALGRMGAKAAIPAIKERVGKESNTESIFWFHVALARLEEDENAQGMKTLKEMKKKKLLTEKQENYLVKLKKQLEHK